MITIFKLYDNYYYTDEQNKYNEIIDNISNNIDFDFNIFSEYDIDDNSGFLLTAAFYKNYKVCEYLINYDRINLNETNEDNETTLNLLSFNYGKDEKKKSIELNLIIQLIDKDVDWCIKDNTDQYFFEWSNDLSEILKDKYPDKWKFCQNTILKNKYKI